MTARNIQFWLEGIQAHQPYRPLRRVNSERILRRESSLTPLARSSSCKSDDAIEEARLSGRIKEGLILIFDKDLPHHKRTRDGNVTMIEPVKALLEEVEPSDDAHSSVTSASVAPASVHTTATERTAKLGWY